MSESATKPADVLRSRLVAFSAAHRTLYGNPGLDHADKVKLSICVDAEDAARRALSSACMNHLADVLDRLNELEAAMAAASRAWSDRGHCERDCRLPLAERIDDTILELRHWRRSFARMAGLLEQNSSIDLEDGLSLSRRDVPRWIIYLDAKWLDGYIDPKSDVTVFDTAADAILWLESPEGLERVADARKAANKGRDALAGNREGTP